MLINVNWNYVAMVRRWIQTQNCVVMDECKLFVGVIVSFNQMCRAFYQLKVLITVMCTEHDCLTIKWDISMSLCSQILKEDPDGNWYKIHVWEIKLQYWSPSLPPFLPLAIHRQKCLPYTNLFWDPVALYILFTISKKWSVVCNDHVQINVYITALYRQSGGRDLIRDWPFSGH